ncbi:MAG: hypothetical protein FWH10_00750 [Oscillospiraceae bacterium]|nr:hypothetical protein [Oscillospiraceae bacterium]
MSDFLDNLGKVVNETAKKAIKASGDVVELTKTSLNIKFDEVKRESFFKEIGGIVYRGYRISPESVSDEILDFCRCIDEIENSISAQRAKAAEIKKKKFCVNCGKELCKTFLFCYSCGASQPEIPDEDEEEEICECGCGCEFGLGNEGDCKEPGPCGGGEDSCNF